MLLMACKQNICDRAPNCPKPLTLFRFLLAQLFFQSLRDKFTPKQITKALNRLRHQSSSPGDDQKLALLRLVYDGAMERINGQMRGHQKLAKHVLSWITCAKRPLTTTELQHAWAVIDSEGELDKDSLPEVEDMISVCAGLVTVDHDGGILRLVHYTTQEYFDQTLDASFPNVHFEIARICARYLSFSAFSDCVFDNTTVLWRTVEANPLYDYAACNWGHHAREAAHAPDEILDFLEKRNHTVVAYEVRWYSKERSRFAHNKNVRIEFSRGFWDRGAPPDGGKALHLAAHFGLETTTMQLLAAGHNPNMQDYHGSTPFYHPLTPLHHAAKKGHVAVVRALLAGNADVTAVDGHERTPLHMACEKGHTAVVQEFLDSGLVDPEQEAQSGSTALIVAVKNQQEAVVRVLLASNRIDVNRTDNFGSTALDYVDTRAWHEYVYAAVDNALVERRARIKRLLRAHGAQYGGDKDEDEENTSGLDSHSTS
jgi:hypothetical protein